MIIIIARIDANFSEYRVKILTIIKPARTHINKTMKNTGRRNLRQQMDEYYAVVSRKKFQLQDALMLHFN